MLATVPTEDLLSTLGPALDTPPPRGTGEESLELSVWVDPPVWPSSVERYRDWRMRVVIGPGQLEDASDERRLRGPDRFRER